MEVDDDPMAGAARRQGAGQPGAGQPGAGRQALAVTDRSRVQPEPSRFVGQSASVADLLLVFLKLPVPGDAKTRLIPHLGPAAAAELYRVLAEEEVRRTTPQAGEYERLFCFAPPSSARRSRAGSPARSCGRNRRATLGCAWPGPSRKGSGAALAGWPSWAPTCPGSPASTCSRPFAPSTLTSWPSAPRHDGGYYLLAMRRPEPRLFEGVAWSTSLVLRETLERAARLGLRTAPLEALTDVDTLDDVRLEWPGFGAARRPTDLRPGSWPRPWANAPEVTRSRPQGSSS